METLADRLYGTLPPGATLVPIIGMSDQTHLSNLSGDKKVGPVYITLGNLLLTRRNSPGSMAVLLLALLPVRPKLSILYLGGQASEANQCRNTTTRIPALV